MSNKLKPCPWPLCRSKNVESQGWENYTVVCLDCGANGPVIPRGDMSIVDACLESVRLWNERAVGDVAGVEISADGMSVTVVKDGYGYEYTLADFYSEKGAMDANGHE